MAEKRPRIVIVGGGFGGLAAAKALARAPAEVIVIDRNDHHVFQPLLYQVATAVLTPSQIGSAIRGIVGRQKNTTVLKCNVTGVDLARRCIFVDSADREAVPISFDFLVLATGVRHSYFGHPEFEPFAPGLKSLTDAVLIRNRILQAFEQAETEADPSKHQDLLTFVLVGAGPTGVEMASAIAILVRSRLRAEYRRVDPAKARIVLIDMMPKVLGTFAEGLSGAATARLGRLGVEVRLGHGVDQIDGEGVVVAGERIASRTVIWTAGVAPSPAGQWLGAQTDKAGRVRVEADLSATHHRNVFVIGDTASLDQDGKPLPGVAQVAMQQGRYVGKLLRRRLNDQADPPPFRYFDKGNMAVVGKGFAVLQSGHIKLSGFVPWLVWAAVHLQFLAQSYLRVSVFLQWVWTYLTGRRGSRLIINPPPIGPPLGPANLSPRTLQSQQLSRT
ncbi:MAG TPA: NAD(P)/FAD-dependent oxidoreductase [Polyangiaceae bacterium]|nr:NAD(P)/FAD-dependent oxidoreductase [Polyangiaceae bacterium]